MTTIPDFTEADAMSAVRLHHAGRLLAGDVELSGVWPRCCAWLLRLAVEHALRELWAARRPELADCPMRTQLLALRRFTDPDSAHDVADVWCALSRLAHHHDYELPPSAAELQHWYHRTARICAALPPR